MRALEGKRVLVTGAGSGIGRACALELARAGGTVVASDRSEDGLAALRKDCPELADTIVGDVDDAGFARDLVASAGTIDIFLNNAGTLTYAPILEIDDAASEAMFRTNVLAALRLAQLVGRFMVQRKSGHIIVMTSTGAREVWPVGTVYCASKHALSAITRGLRLDLQLHGIKVTEIAPGMVDTTIRDRSRHPRVLEAMQARTYTPLTVDDVAAAVLFAATAAPNHCPDLIELRAKGAAVG
jgi:NADP-dependent 3-hydroxy acid dehydrogenase YdfG